MEKKLPPHTITKPKVGEKSNLKCGMYCSTELSSGSAK